MTSRPTTTMSHAANEASKTRAVAYYRSTAAEADETIESQREQVHRWADENGIEIVREFVDASETGRHTEERPGFSEMLEDWVKKSPSFRYVLCLNAASWGRFHDVDLSNYYTAECAKAHKEVVYTATGELQASDPYYPMYMHFQRMRFHEYHDELGDKVRRGHMLATQKGYWTGGNPPYGTQRLLLDGKGKPLRLLEPGEQKAIRNHRVALVAGEPAEVAAIRHIFREFVDMGYSRAQIAKGLNAKGNPSPRGGPWNARQVLACLRTKAYAKPITYRLKKSRRGKTSDQWVHTPKAKKGLIGLEQFQRAQEILA